MRSSEKFVLSAILGVTLMGCATDSAIGPNDDLRPAFLVTYTPEDPFACPATPGLTCIGFVGKGDVQDLYGLNNKAMQDNAEGFFFFVESADTYSAVCTWVTGEGTNGQQTHNVTHSRKTAINSAIASDPRRTGQWTGFNLLSLGGTTETGEVPEVGGACPGNQGHGGTWSSVTQTGGSGSSLFVDHPTLTGGPYALN